MPVIGTLCCRTGEPARFDSCIGCAKTGKPARCKHPLHILESMRTNEATRANAGLSVTSLLGCQRRAQLHREYDYYEDPTAVEARFKGTLVHEGMERLTKDHHDVIQEVRYARRIGDQAITGKMDLILPDFDGGPRIVDFKSAGRRKLAPDMVPSESHVEQVNVYRWILEDGYEAEATTLEVGGYERVWHETVQMKVGSAAILYIGDNGMQEVEIPLWPLAMTEAFVADKVNAYNSRALAPILPDKVVRKRDTSKDPVIYWGDFHDQIPPQDPAPTIVTEPHWMCKGCALFDICRSLPAEGIEWNGDGDS